MNEDNEIVIECVELCINETAMIIAKNSTALHTLQAAKARFNALTLLIFSLFSNGTAPKSRML